ncbi:MAG: protein kinase family protein [Planctomycetota bacterium]|jgi:hypothetical protein
MLSAFGHHLYACGKKGMPRQIAIGDGEYHFCEVLKHDFFAATGLYRLNGQSQSARSSKATKVILKIDRRQHFLGLPLSWVGKILCRHEIFMLNFLGGLRGIPRFISCYGRNGFVYEYIEGNTLAQSNSLPDGFFDELLKLLEQIHRRNIAYLDLNKRSNVICGADKKPYFIDFQISLHIGDRILIWKRPSRGLWEVLKRADIYHLFKHKRQLCPDSLRPEEKQLSHCPGRSIRLHRVVAGPFKKLRRSLLKYLYRKGVITPDKEGLSNLDKDSVTFGE